MSEKRRFFTHSERQAPANVDARNELLKSLTSIVHGCPPKQPWVDGFKDKGVGLWTGPTSIAYLFLWLAQTHPKTMLEGRSPTEWCNAYLDCGQADIPNAHGLNHWGVKNEYLAYHAVKACVTKDMQYADKLREAVVNGFDCPDADNEHLSGRAGTLSLLRIVRHFVPESAAAMTECMKPLIEHMLEARPWRFHKHNYIGAAHGQIGNITQIVLCDPQRAAAVEPTLLELLDLQNDAGHWFITDDPNLGEHDLVHHCHGSPGFVMSLMKIRKHFSGNTRDRIDTAIDKGRREVWELGLLTKEPNLCHGIAGNMLAFEDWDQRAAFMAFATMDEIETGKREARFIKGDDPYGLLWGEAGRAWGWMLMDSKRDLGYPSYTDVLQ